MLAPRRVPPCLTASVAGVDHFQERYRARGDALGLVDEAAAGTHAGEIEARSAALL